MTEATKQRWIDNLESGRFKFGKGHLYRDGCHCALGVLCEMAIEDKKLGKPGADTGYVGFHYMPPPIVTDHFDLYRFLLNPIAKANDTAKDYAAAIEVIRGLETHD